MGVAQGSTKKGCNVFRVRQKARQHEGTALKSTTRKIAGTLETSFTGGGEKGATRRDVHRLLPLQLVPLPKERVPSRRTVVISTIYFRDNNYSHGEPSRTFIKQEFPPPCGRVYLTGVAELQRRYSVCPAIVRCDERWWSWWMPRIVRDYLHAGQLRLFCDCTSCWYFDGFYFLLEFIDAAFFFFFFFYIFFRR